MHKPRLLDLFSGAGGAGMGYCRAGFDVVGIDIKPMPRYPFEFYQADAFEYLAEHGHEFDAIHASPPCQGYSEATPVQYRETHPNLIGPIRRALQATGKPYIIENVEGARRLMVTPVKLCGTMFGMPIWRHRYFEVWPAVLMLTPPCYHRPRPITVYSGSYTRKTWEPILCTGGGDGVRSGRKFRRPRESVDVVRWAMGIDWMVQEELTEAIPPAYTEWIGRQLLALLPEPLDTLSER